MPHPFTVMHLNFYAEGATLFMKRRTMYLLFGLLVFAHLLPFLSSFAQDSQPAELPALDTLENGWSTLVPGGDTVCSRGTPYQFFVRKAENPTDKLLIYFQGGGACWNALTCREDGGTFDDAVGTLEQEVLGYDGVFNYENPANPLIDYNVVFVPYCTGDIHIGDTSTRYLTIGIEHRGVDNSMSALNWAFSNFSTPQQIVIAGTSAGAYGAIYFTPLVAEQYPDATIVQHGDAGVGVSPVGWDVLQTWDIYANIPQFETVSIDPETFEIRFLYEGAASYPNVQLSQFTTNADDVQTLFYSFSAPGGAPWTDGMYASLETLDALPNFSSYVAGGELHTVLARPEFYTLTSNGVKFVDWFTALVKGEDVENVRCVACETEEFSD